MKGLWHLTSRAINPGLGVVVFDALVASMVIFFTVISIARRSKQWPEAWTLHIGMLLLSIWSVLHLSDVLVHFRQARVPYGYILVGCLYKALRVISDVFVLWGTVRVLIRYSHLRPNIRKPQSIFCVATVVAVLLLFVGLYQICLMFALSFAWLSFSDLNVIDAIAKARSGSEIAFTALEFVSTIVITFWAKMEFRAALEDGTNYYVESSWARPASIALLIRSFCELVIVGQLSRRPAGIQTINRARDITYGLFSVFFVGCITFAIPAKSYDDDLLARREVIAREGVKTLVMQKLAVVTQHGGKTAPTIPAILEDLERVGPLRCASKPPPEGPITANQMKRAEIDRLKAVYVDWEPIYKWPGKDGGSGAG